MKTGYLRTEKISDVKTERNNLTAISLFTGCGGAALGLANAGYEVRVMVEWDKSACDTLRANWTREGFKNRHPGERIGYWGKSKWHQKREPAILEADITELETKDILKAGGLKVGEAFILEGGFPCQGFSYAGKRMINDPRNKLYKECVRVIKEALPRAFFLENVPGLVSMLKGSIIIQIVKDLASCGYSVRWDILNAADYGVPQNRKRVFFIGYRNDLMRFTEKGNVALHMGVVTNEMTFPEWFYKRYKKRNPAVASLQIEKGVKIRNLTSKAQQSLF